MIKLLRVFGMAAALSLAHAQAAELSAPRSGFGALDHVFLIIMENETDTDILGNANAPFINACQDRQSSGELFRGRPSERSELS